MLMVIFAVNTIAEHTRKHANGKHNDMGTTGENEGKCIMTLYQHKLIQIWVEHIEGNETGFG